MYYYCDAALVVTFIAGMGLGGIIIYAIRHLRSIEGEIKRLEDLENRKP